MTTSRYRKRPVEVDTVQWTGTNEAELIAFTGNRFEALDPEDRADDPEITAQVLDALHSTWVGVKTGQHIVRGVKGEYYPIAEDVLAETYERVDDGPAATEATEPRVTVYGIDVSEWDRMWEVVRRIETAVTGWRAEDHAGHGSLCEERSDGTCAQPLDRPGLATADTETTDRVLSVLHRSAEDTVTRVITLHEQWVAAGPPPLGAPLARWWDARLAELHNAIQPADQTTE